MPRTLWFFDDAEIDEMSGMHRSAGPVEKLGPVRMNGEPWDHEPCASFAGTIIERPGGGWRMYYSWYRSGVFRIALAESGDGLDWRHVALDQNPLDRSPGNHFAIRGLDRADNVIQPQVVRASDGGWLMWFWLHAHDRGLVRYLAARSDDGIDWMLIDLDRPAIFHPADREVGQNGWVAGLTRAAAEDRFTLLRTYDWMEAKRLRSNDATYVYVALGGGYVMYSVWLLPNHPETGRHVPHDNAPNVARSIHRRTSADGLSWSDPELVIAPDRDDPLDQQFYYLAAEPVDDEPGAPLVGYLGHYRVEAQTMDISLAFSRDGRRWERPVREGWIPRGGPGAIDMSMNAAANRTIPLPGGKRLMLYTGHNELHNHQLPPGVTEKRRAIMGAVAREGRFIGLRADKDTTARLLTRPFIATGPAITVDADVRGVLRATLCDAFGAPLEGYGLADADPVASDGRRVLAWRGKDSSAYRYDAVRLRIEVEDGTVYRVET